MWFKEIRYSRYKIKINRNKLKNRRNGCSLWCTGKSEGKKSANRWGTATPKGEATDFWLVFESALPIRLLAWALAKKGTSFVFSDTCRALNLGEMTSVFKF